MYHDRDADAFRLGDGKVRAIMEEVEKGKQEDAKKKAAEFWNEVLKTASDLDLERLKTGDPQSPWNRR